MHPDDMKRRTKEFAQRVIWLCRELPPTREGRRIGDQLFRAGTSVGASYRAACRARSRADHFCFDLEDREGKEAQSEICNRR
jgi:four helix bundle protein